MSVYVDEMLPCVPNKNWRWKQSAHLIADTGIELHRFAKSIGLKRSWFQRHTSIPHYDLTVGKRKQAIAKGAIPIDRKQFVFLMQEQRIKKKKGK